MRYYWPGNVRELKNVIERAVVLCNSNKIDVVDLPRRIVDAKSDTKGITIPFCSTLKQAEKKIILTTLESVSNNKTKAAKLLGVSLKTLHNKLATYK